VRQLAARPMKDDRGAGQDEHKDLRPEPDAPRPEKARRPKVLVADDDLDARTMYGMYLQRMGCTVFTAIDGESAVDQAMAVLPDLCGDRH